MVLRFCFPKLKRSVSSNHGHSHQMNLQARQIMFFTFLYTLPSNFKGEGFNFSWDEQRNVWPTQKVGKGKGKAYIPSIKEHEPEKDMVMEVIFSEWESIILPVKKGLRYSFDRLTRLLGTWPEQDPPLLRNWYLKHMIPHGRNLS